MLDVWQNLNQLSLPEIIRFVIIHAWPLLLAAACAGLVDSIGGGGGLITVPTLLTLGVPAPLLLGTNKCISTFGSLPAVIRYARAGLLPDIHGRMWIGLFVMACLLSSLGAYLSQQSVILENLHVLVPLLLFAVMAFMLKRWFWDEPRAIRKVAQLGPEDRDSESQIHLKLGHPFALLGLGAVAFYDGLFGPGTGTFFLTLFERLGLKTITANAMTKIFNLASNIGALVWFASQGRVIWTLGACAVLFYLCGNYIGAGLVLRRGQKLVRVVVLLATTGLLLKHLSRYL